MLDCCYGKEGYNTPVDAKRVLSRMHKRGTLRGSVKVYRCAACGLYHMGSNITGKKVYARGKIYG